MLDPHLERRPVAAAKRSPAEGLLAADIACAGSACVRTSRPSGGTSAREKEGTRPSGRMRLAPRVSIICLELRASARCASAAFGLGAEVLLAGQLATPTLPFRARNEPRSSLSACLSRGPSQGPRDLRHVRLLRHPSTGCRLRRASRHLGPRQRDCRSGRTASPAVRTRADDCKHRPTRPPSRPPFGRLLFVPPGRHGLALVETPACLWSGACGGWIVETHTSNTPRMRLGRHRPIQRLKR